MNVDTQTYGDLIRLDPGNQDGVETLRRIPLGTRVDDGGMDESSLRNLLFQFPRSLPVESIDAAYSNPVPICTELPTGAGAVDALYINALGRLILAEFKLWRNPQARREVIGQILDYSKELASWSYADLMRVVSRRLDRKGNVPYQLVRAQLPGVDETQFGDNVSRHLKRGEFLLLIIGDGIREGVESIVQFVQSHSGLHFNLALVEAALYRDTDNRVIVQPRVLMRTEVIRRVVLQSGRVEDLVGDDEDTEDNALRPAAGEHPVLDGGARRLRLLRSERGRSQGNQGIGALRQGAGLRLRRLRNYRSWASSTAVTRSSAVT